MTTLPCDGHLTIQNCQLLINLHFSVLYYTSTYSVTSRHEFPLSLWTDIHSLLMLVGRNGIVASHQTPKNRNNIQTNTADPPYVGTLSSPTPETQQLKICALTQVIIQSSVSSSSHHTAHSWTVGRQLNKKQLYIHIYTHKKIVLNERTCPRQTLGDSYPFKGATKVITTIPPRFSEFCFERLQLRGKRNPAGQRLGVTISSLHEF